MRCSPPVYSYTPSFASPQILPLIRTDKPSPSPSPSPSPLLVLYSSLQITCVAQPQSPLERIRPSRLPNLNIEVQAGKSSSSASCFSSSTHTTVIIFSAILGRSSTRNDDFIVLRLLRRVLIITQRLSCFLTVP